MSDRVTIVGGGVIGIACAHYLSKAGLTVTVIDRGAIGGACSRGNCGYVCPSHVLPLTEPGAVRAALKSLFTPGAAFRVKPRLSPALWGWMWQFARRCNHDQMLRAGRHLQAILDASMAEYRTLMAAEQLDCEWKTAGLLYVLKTERGVEEFSHTVDTLREHFHVNARHVEGKDLPSLDPSLLSGLAGGFLYEGDASLRPDLLCAAWTQRLRERGVTFIEQCELRAIERRDRRISRLQTSQGDRAADHVVIATGAWSPRLSSQLNCRIPIEPGKGYSVTMPRPNHCPRYPILFPEHRVGVSPFERGYRLGSMMEFAGYDESIPARRIEQLKRSAEHYLVSPHTEGEQETWFGWRPMTYDSLPILGRVPGLSNAYLATGHNMLGMTLAPATGRLIAELVTGRPTHLDATPYAVERFG